MMFGKIVGMIPGGQKGTSGKTQQRLFSYDDHIKIAIKLKKVSEVCKMLKFLTVQVSVKDETLISVVKYFNTILAEYSKGYSGRSFQVAWIGELIAFVCKSGFVFSSRLMDLSKKTNILYRNQI